MGNGSAADWSGGEFLTQVGGTSAEYPPAKVFFLVHRSGASGRLWLTQNADIRTVDLIDGAIVDCSGFPDLLQTMDIQGERSQGIAEIVASAVEAGHEESKALEEAAISLCAMVLAMDAEEPWMVQFAVGGASPAKAVALPIHVMAAMEMAVRRTDVETQERAWIDTHIEQAISVSRPDGGAPETWGLNAETLAFLETVEQGQSIGGLADSLGGDSWAALGILRRLGLIGVATEKAEVRAESPVSDPEKRSRFDRPRGGRRGKERQRRKKRREPDDPIAAILQCAPWEQPKEEMDQQLRDAYSVLTEQTPDVIFGMSTTKDLDKEWIERRFHEACARYHPDRYLDCSQAVQSLAEGCFTAVSTAFHALAEPEVLERVTSRLIEKETGKKPVTDKTRQRARLHFAKAELLYRQRQYDECHQLLVRAVEGDPEKWQYAYLLTQAAWRGQKMSVDDAVNSITALDGMTSRERGDALCLAGEMYMSEKREREAFRMFHDAVKADPENVGAQRRLRLRDRRVEAAKREEKEAKGFLGGLFQRRKD